MSLTPWVPPKPFNELTIDGANRDPDSITVSGVAYLIGSAGSFIVACEVCGSEHFRELHRFLTNPSWETCFTCKPLQYMVPVRVDEMETKWIPLWRSLGHNVKGYPCNICGETWSWEHDKEKHNG